MALSASSVRAAAQDFSPPRLDRLVQPGSQVKIATASGQVLKGTVRSVSEASLSIDDKGLHEIPVDDIRTVSARVGRRPILLGAVLGAGAAIGIVLIANAADDNADHCTPNDWFCGGDFGPSNDAMAAILVAIGGGAGAVAGALSPRSMKVVYEAPIRSRATLSPMIGRGRIGVALSVPF